MTLPVPLRKKSKRVLTDMPTQRWNLSRKRTSPLGAFGAWCINGSAALDAGIYRE